MEERTDEKKKGLTPRQQRKALEWLDELARGERKHLALNVTSDGSLQDCVEGEFVER